MDPRPKNLQRSAASARKRVLMHGTIYAPTGAHAVWVRDVSQYGALVTTELPLPKDCDLIFKRGPIFAAGHVAWVQGRNAGLHFYRPVPEEQLLLAVVPDLNRDR